VDGGGREEERGLYPPLSAIHRLAIAGGGGEPLRRPLRREVFILLAEQAEQAEQAERDSETYCAGNPAVTVAEDFAARP
jgi:hypothetical protein